MEEKQEIIPNFTKEDFETGTGPYEYLYSFRENGFRLEQLKSFLQNKAKELKVTGFSKKFTEYVKLQKYQVSISGGCATEFEGQPIELATGEWVADDTGISRMGKYGEEVACNHPIMPVRRLSNIDTGIEKIELAYRKGKQWRRLIIDRRTVASANSIIALADYGIGVTSENARCLVRFLNDTEYINYDLITENNSVSRLGWIKDEGFSPYVEDLVFDGETSFKAFFESVTEHGKYEKWLDVAKQSRQGSIYARVVLAASFSSVLAEPLGVLPFFVHFWGGTEAGKTVALMLGASVWADPTMGKYIHTFNSTAVGQEKSAGFVNSMPLIFDELQILADKKSFDNLIYMLSEGIGKSRGNKTGGMQRVDTWHNCILTSGEMPITTASSGGGAINRIIEIECLDKIFSDPREVVSIIKKHYGFAGKMFVEKLQENGNIERALEVFKEFYSEVQTFDTTDKQGLTAALILTADKLATEWIFKDGHALAPDDVKPFLQTRKAVSSNERAYEYICEYVVQNSNKFCGESTDFEVWGKIENDVAFIVVREFNRICNDAGFNPTAFRSWLRSTNRSLCKDGRYTYKTRINGNSINCVAILLDDENIEKADSINDIEDI